MMYKWCNIIIWIYFFWWENGLHRRFHPQTGGGEQSSLTVGALITNGLWTGGDDPSYHQRLKSNAPQTGGDAHFEPAVMGGAGVVSLEVDWTKWNSSVKYK